MTAADGASPSLTSTGLVRIDLNNENDNKPVIIPSDFAVILSEGVLLGTSVLQYAVSDADTAVDGCSLVNVDSFFQVRHLIAVGLFNKLIDLLKLD